MNARNLLITLMLVALSPSLAFSQALPSPDDLSTPPEKKEAPKPEVVEPPVKTEEVTEKVEEKTDTSGDVAAMASPAEDKSEVDSFSKRKTDKRFVQPKVNLEGSLGIQHLAYAWTGSPNTYNIGLLVEFFSGSDAIRFNDTNTLFGGNLLFQANFTDWFSANLRLGTRNNVNTFGQPEAMLSQGDVLLGLKAAWELSQGFHLGGDLTVEVPTDFGTAGLGFSGTSVRPRLLASLDFAEMTQSDVQMHGHFNLGYQIDNSESLIPDNYRVSRVERFAYNLSAYDSVDINLGLVYDLPYVSPFLAWNLAIPVGGGDDVCNDPTGLPCVSDAGFASFPSVLSVGAKAQVWERLGIHAGVDIGLSSDDAAGLPVTAPYTLVGGFSWTIDPNPRIERIEIPIEVEKEPVIEAPKLVFLTGALVDKDSGEPVKSAIIEYPIGGETAQASNAKGGFRSYGFTPGSAVKLTITHPDYEPVEFETRVDEKGEGDQPPFTVQMVPLPKIATLSGLVENEKGEPIQGAKIKIVDGEGKQKYTAATTSAGKYLREIKAGSYTILVSAPDYLTRGKDIKVEANAKLDTQFVLKPKPKKVLVKLRDDKIEIQQKIFFETGKANILSKSFGLLDQVVSLVVENPQVKKISIEGHTDDVGSDDSNLKLSQARAESVRNYLAENGVSVERLSARGYGETRPILPNTSKRNRSLNRRVEFKIQK